nr:DUF5309 family protein [Actinomycetota bacterium]
MAGITGMGTTFNLPNFVGELFNLSTEDTPLLSTIGGLTGGREAADKIFEWEFYDLRAADLARQRVEGANAPTAEERVRANASSVLEIHQEAVSVSYTKMSIGNTGSYATSTRGRSPIADEMAWQMDQQIKQVARDIELSFISGTFANPGTNAAPRKTRGLLEAIATNVVSNSNGNADAGGDVTGNAATDVVATATAHGLTIGDTVTFTTLNGGAGLVVNTTYYVRSAPSTTSFTLAAARGGALLDFTTAIATG